VRERWAEARSHPEAIFQPTTTGLRWCFFLLAARQSHLTHLFFDDDASWLQEVMERTDFSASAVADLLEQFVGADQVADGGRHSEVEPGRHDPGHVSEIRVR
jgi:hypothetical protein